MNLPSRSSLPNVFTVPSIPPPERLPGATCYFMHPVKQRGAIRAAYGQHGVRYFVVDHPDELAKIRAETGQASDVVVIVRLATAFSFVKAKATGDKPDTGDHKKVDL